jgi:glycosyltransferase involved in cell wall biosynthesis
MLTSIITPTYNSIKYIQSTYESILNQTYTNWEWLITDDCSSDGTYELLYLLAEKDSRIKIFKNKVNSGAAVTRNNSISHATGEYIAFLDSDDVWLPNKLEEQLRFMGNKISFSFTAYELINEDGNKLNLAVDLFQQGDFTYQDMLKKKATLGCSTVIIRRKEFSDITMPLLRTGQDYALWLKLLKQGKNAHVFNKILTSYRILPDSISRNKFKKAKRQWQIYRDVEKLSFDKSIVCFCFYAWRAVFRK